MISLAIAAFMLVLGALIKYGKMYSLIAGYNTLSEEEKAKYNKEKLGSVFFNGMAIMAFIIVVGYIISLWAPFSYLDMLFIFIAVLIGLPYILVKGNSQKMRK